MTAVPQRTALSHAFGALSAALIGIAEYYVARPHVPKFEMAEIGLEVIIGSLTFTGSLIAAGKLQEILPQRPITYKGQNYVSLVGAGRGDRADGDARRAPGIYASVSGDDWSRAGFWRDAGHAHRRRGHAHGDLAVELLRRIFRGAAWVSCSTAKFWWLPARWTEPPASFFP